MNKGHIQAESASLPCPAHPANSTKWGDGEGRRRDILEAARLQIADGGYLALNMRSIARGASVSPGTLYTYFATKEEIFATLYAEAIEAYNLLITPICESAQDLENLLIEVTSAYIDLYANYGRYFTLWSALATSTRDESNAANEDAPTQLPRALALQLRRATFASTDLLLTTLRRVTPSSSGQPKRMIDEPMAMTLLWTLLNGIGDHLTSERRHLTPFPAKDLVVFSARTLAAGLLTPVAATTAPRSQRDRPTTSE